MGALRLRAPGLLGLALLSGCAAGGSPQAGLPPSATYVAMGSSFAAGPGLGLDKADMPARCQRSGRNYATLLAERLNLTLIDVTCGGATTTHVLEGWSELPPQIAAVTADTRLVTITIGGNDVGYVRNLMAASCQADAARCYPRAQATAADWAKDDANLREIVRAVRRRAPQARVVFVDYLTLLPKRGTCPAVAMPAADLASGRATAARLVALTARVAREEGAQVLSAAALSQGHTACDAQPWSVGAAVTDRPAGGIAWHPNIPGMRAIADALAARFAAGLAPAR